MSNQPTLRFLDQPAPCRRCGKPAWTRKLGGRVPLHPSCDHRGTDEPTVEQVVDLLADLSNLCGPLHLDPPAPPTQPEHVGPCVTCHKPTCRYGPYGRTHCYRCDEETPRMKANQPPLFPLGICKCEHVVPVAQDEEPCPDCLGDPYDPHDCPLLIMRHVTGKRERR